MSTKESPYPVADDEQIMMDITGGEFYRNPLAFVEFAYPWGQPNTPLEHFKGPRTWQRDELIQLGEHIKSNEDRIKRGLMPEVYRSAIKAGRGPGKSALFAWLTNWMMSVQIGSTTIATANTGGQLASKTWPELGKWHGMSINEHWFDRSTLKMQPQEWFKKLVKEDLKIDSGYYYAEAQLWSEENPDAFAGAHNPLGMLVIFDEASNIHEKIHTITRGFFSEPVLHRYWIQFGNPRRSSGAFYQCFHRDRDQWNRRTIDTRTVEGIDVAEAQKILDTYGEDSDEARVEVKGEFPARGDRQFISNAVVDEARKREIVFDSDAPLILGVDPARFGGDRTVARFRRGRTARAGVDVPPKLVLKGKDNMQVANEIAHLIDQYNPDAVCIDAGNGTGIIDRLKERGYRVIEVWFGAESGDRKYGNKRTKLWGDMREWLNGGAIDADQDLYDDLTGPEYDFVGTDGDVQQLEPKAVMKKRGLASPDDGDALACTFAARIAHKGSKAAAGNGSNRRPTIAKGVDYRVLG